MFRIPSYINKRIENHPPIYITEDNKSLYGINTIAISDELIKESYKKMIKTNLSTDIVHEFAESLIHIGSKDEADPIILNHSIRVSLRLANKLRLRLVYLPHPSMYYVGAEKYNIIFQKYSIKTSDYSPIEYLLYESDKKLNLCGDATSVMVTALRLGHNYFCLNRLLEGIIPEKPHLNDTYIISLINSNTYEHLYA